MDSSFPSIFIRLPRMPGTQWVPADIVEVLDRYGDIKEVSIKKDVRGEQYAVVQFNEWYPDSMNIANAIYHGKPVRVRALYRKTFDLIVFRTPKVAKVSVAPGISFGNPGQLSAIEFLTQKKQNAASAFRRRSNSDVSDVTMEDDFDYQRKSSHYYRHYPLEDGEIV